MTNFIQLHLLTSYPPANLNRDDTGQPKTAMMGGVLRARVSSQSLKRAWRTSPIFAERLAGHIGTRTKRFSGAIQEAMIAAGKTEEQAKAAAASVSAVFAKVDKDDAPHTGQLVHLSPNELATVDALASRFAAGEAVDPTQEALLGGGEGAADIAMFGRMLADKPAHSVEAAVQVAHALTTHRITVEDDYFTAVDDLKSRTEDSGAAHVGETEFVAGVFYLYICIDRDLLARNLGDEALANTAVRALVEAAAKIAPTGKQATFASRAYASFILAERGSQQPRSLSLAFLKPVSGTDTMEASAQALQQTVEKMDAAYGSCADERCTMDVAKEGTLAALLDFVGR